MWTDKRTTQESLYILGKLSELCNRGPVSLELLQLVRDGKLKEVVEYKFDYNLPPETWGPGTCSLYDFAAARQIQAFYSKADFLALGVDREAAALDKFIEAEEHCLWTNRKLAYLRRKPEKASSAFHGILYHAKRKISKVLGPWSAFIDFEPKFGPGANTTVKGHSSSARLKLGAQLACSSNLLATANEHLSDVPMWAAVHSTFEDEVSWIVELAVTPGKLMFVPKNALTQRSIIVEPVLNSYLQKGVGSFIKDRLLAFGVDLRDQTFNQRLARYGSVCGDVSTLDLSSASDTLSKELVFELLPLDWAEYLDSLCTREVTFRGHTFKLEKFSSMGNGFTFELESLVFWALAKGACAYRKVDSTLVNVFGDDIIVPKAADSALREVLSEVGFTVNNSKSYSSGPFRESCGADFYNGMDIRPYYCKTLISDRTLYTAHNWFVRKSLSWEGFDFPMYEELAHECARMIKGEQLWGPDGYGDGHLVSLDFSSKDLRRGRSLKRSGWCGGFFDTYSLKPRSNRSPSKGDRAFPTYSVYTRSGALDETDPNVVRGSRGYAKISIYILPGDLTD